MLSTRVSCAYGYYGSFTGYYARKAFSGCANVLFGGN